MSESLRPTCTKGSRQATKPWVDDPSPEATKPEIGSWGRKRVCVIGVGTWALEVGMASPSEVYAEAEALGLLRECGNGQQWTIGL